jgi:phosphate transport system permease protein
MPRNNMRRATNALMTTLTAGCALFVVTILLLILVYIAMRGLTSINLQFLIDTPKPVGEGGGIGNAIVGSLVLLLIASLIGLPFGIAAGIYLAEFGDNWFANIVRFVTDTLTGVPSIVIGVFVYTLIVLPQKHFSTLAGGVALALIVIPIVTRTTEEMIRLVPTSLREGALALGAPQWRVTLGVVLPAAATGIATGAMLAVARVSGETAPLLFTAFGSRFYNYYLDQPMASLTVQIYNYAISPYDEWHAQAWAATLVLMTLILFINIAVRFFTRKKI